MPFLRQAHGLGLRPNPLPLSNNTALYPSTVRFASHWNKHKKNHAARDSQAKAHPDHNEIGKRQKPFWKSITPDFLTQQIESPLRQGGHFAQVSSFKLHASHKSGSKPTIEASSTSWDSKTNEVSHTVYDPISGRMVPAVDGQSRQNSTSAKNRKNNQSTEKTYQKPTILSQLPQDGEALTNTPTTHASFTEDLEKTYKSEHDELLAARKHLDILREQIQILERQVHPEMTKPEYAVDAERPAVFEDGWDNNPRGLQTAFQHEKEACEHGEMEPLEQEMVALNKSPAQELNDDYSVAPSGMETLFANEQKGDDLDQKSFLEQELAAMNTKAPHLDDSHSTSPKGLETLFEKEQQEADKGQRESLEDEVRTAVSADGQPQYIDGFGKEPIGLETMYDREQQGSPQRLEHELENMVSIPAVRDPDDSYSTDPIGMQILYVREAEGSQKGQHKDLEHELHDHIQARNLNEGFLANLKGMQTLWKREQEDVEKGSARSLEEEIIAQQQLPVTANEYDTSPFGMETHFRNETQDTGDGKSRTLEEEMSRRVQAQTLDDGCSRSPSGLQTAFDNEEKDAMLGNRKSLETEMKNREPGFEDGYSTMPMGLQMMFRREKQGHGRSLEEDIKQMEEASYHEDGYSRAPFGMENSFEREVNAEPDSLEADLKNMPGEGDLSPTVGKFATSDKWYKQPARSTFSEDSPKAGVKELDQHTAVFGRSLDEEPSTPVESSVPSPKTTIEAEYNLTTSATESDSTDASLAPESSQNIAWAQPALYKIIAYDSRQDAVSVTTTPSNFSDAETPISVPRAISQLAQTARFLPHLSSLQNKGFQVINAERDFLILRKLHEQSESKSLLYDGDINPVDGTTKRIPIEPATVRFASPTGFVNYEPIFPTEPTSIPTGATESSSNIPSNGHPEFQQQQIYYQHCKEKRSRWRRRMTWVLSVAAGTAVSTYVIGVFGELAQPDKHVIRSTK